MDWYLERVAAAVAAAKKVNAGGNITMLAHSAGGWLGRLYLLDFKDSDIDRLVSLGSPHLPPPDGVVDQTRGILNYVNEASPGAFHSDIEYVTICGRYIRGSSFFQSGTLSSKLVGLGYKQVCGASDVWGDGVVPLPSAHLEGATQVELDGIYHSPLGSSSGLIDANQKETPDVPPPLNIDSDDYDDAFSAAVPLVARTGNMQRFWYVASLHSNVQNSVYLNHAPSPSCRLFLQVWLPKSLAIVGGAHRPYTTTMNDTLIRSPNVNECYINKTSVLAQIAPVH